MKNVLKIIGIILAAIIILIAVFLFWLTHRDASLKDTYRESIATGGSVVYCEEAMEHLKSIGTVIYLKLSLESLSKRLGNLVGRGVVLKKGQTLEHLYDERTPLYEKYADLTIDEENQELEDTLQTILNCYKK